MAELNSHTTHDQIDLTLPSVNIFYRRRKINPTWTTSQ